jgi:ABC-2 type transport system ATP-binding protein
MLDSFLAAHQQKSYDKHGTPAARRITRRDGRKGRALTATSPAIETTDLTKHYGDLVAVDHLTISVNRGEIFGFLGPNGSGKSTTMRMLLGLAHPTSGQACLLGMDVRTQLPEILRHTGALIENPTFYPFLSGRDNLRVVADLTGADPTRIDAVLDLVDMRADADRPFTAYSLGMKQRIGVASALLTDPDILILDEPANGLDPAGIVEMRTLMHRLREAGHTVFVSSHVLHEIEQVCDRIAILNHGRVIAQGGVQQLLGETDRIEVQVDRAAEALPVLKDLPWVSDVSLEDGALIIAAPITRSAEINQILAGHGFWATIIRPRQESLERYFLELTGGAA